MNRPIAGRLNGIHAEPGTILGPRETTREFLAVIDNDAEGVTVGYATRDELEAVAGADHNARSVTEHRIRRMAGAEIENGPK